MQTPKLRTLSPAAGAVFISAFLFVFALAFSGNSLRQGQEIKQFYSYGVTKALIENGFHIFQTYLPCTDTRTGSYPRPWAEEPPVFSAFAVMLVKLGLTDPAWPTLFVGLLTSLAVAWLVLLGNPVERRLPLLLLVALGSPVWMRHYSQHMPDTMAVLFFVLGMIASLKRRTALMLACLMLAVAAKAYAIFPASTFLLWKFGPRRPLHIGLSLALLASPFVAWVFFLHHWNVPNPYDFTSVAQNRHSGSFSVVLTKKYWDMFLTYVGTKGIGWILFAGFLYAVVDILRRWRDIDEYHAMLVTWAAGVVPFWLAVREASIVHDHYVLQYFLPMALLGAEAILSIRWAAVRYFLVAVSVVMGLANPVIWRRRAADLPPGDFCDSEVHSLVKFPPSRK